MRRTYFACFALILISFSLPAQSLYMPRDVQKAFKKGTRSQDGRPGKNYWQNRGRYDITIRTAPPDRKVQGHESITYFNNSPDTLRTLVFKLFLNIHRPGAPRLRGVSEDYLTSGVHIDSISVNGRPASWNNNRSYFTSVPFRLPAPLNAHDSIKLNISWHYDVSLLSDREGMIDSTTYFLAYFYPRVAVYDDYEGWDNMTFNDALEFYSDFNDYSVQVQVPSNFIVWGTGTLQNASQVLKPAALEKFNQSFNSSAVQHIATKNELASHSITTAGQWNTWKFTSTNIPDVAFGISDHFNWDAGSVVVDRKTGRRASVQTAYNDTARDYHLLVPMASHALDWLSNEWPGIPYPYEKTTIFQGYAGMEYPMMANDETYEDTTFSKFVAMHEIAHSYMPFYMGINETRYGFMDEGWATTFELLFNRHDMGKENADDFYKQFRVNGWAHTSAPDEDLPIITPGPNLNGGGLGNNQYGKPSLGYLAAKEILGDELFKKALHAYMDRWHGKHPLPWDFFNSINDASGQNLNWFWNNWFFSTYYIDLALEKVTGTEVTIKNIGGLMAPFDLVISYANGTNERMHLGPQVWKNKTNTITVPLTAKKKIASVTIDGGIYMDADESNNTITIK